MNEPRLDNDIFFACSVIEYIGRQTKNKRNDIVVALGEAEITKLIDLADVLHCEPIEVTAHRLIEKHKIPIGSFDNLTQCKYTVPTFFDIAKVYKRLIVDIANTQAIAPPLALAQAYASFISEKIDDYNASMYFENPQYVFASFTAGKALP